MMYGSEFNTSLHLYNENLRHEVEDLHKTLQSVVKENMELRSKLDRFYSSSDPVVEKSQMSSAGRKSRWQDSFVGESSFRSDLIAPHLTSTPVRHTQSRTVRPDRMCSSSFLSRSSSLSPHTVKHPEQLLGEIAFQLERRILSHIFYKQKRLYGFTIQNIHDKIIQVSTHPLTGQVDKVYRSELTQRYQDLMGCLGALGYNMMHYPLFCEFIVNTYGILEDHADVRMAQQWSYSDLDVLESMIVETAPSALLKDMLVLCSCLRYLVTKDRKPFILF